MHKVLPLGVIHPSILAPLFNISNNSIWSFNPPLSSPYPTNTSLLVLPKPGFSRLAKNLFSHKINDETADDADESEGIHPVDMKVEDFDANDDAPVHVNTGKKREEKEKTEVTNQKLPVSKLMLKKAALARRNRIGARE